MGPTLARPLLFLGVAAAVISAAAWHSRVLADPAYDLVRDPLLGWTLAYLVMLGGSVYAVGLPELRTSGRSAVLAGVLAVGAAAGGLSFAQLLLGAPLLPRFVIAAVTAVTVVWSVVCAHLARTGAARGAEADRLFIVAATADLEALADDLVMAPERPAQVVGQLTPQDAAAVSVGSRPLNDAIERTGATVLLLSRAAQDDERIVVQAGEAHAAGVRVRTLSRFYEEWLGKIPVGELERMSLLVDVGDIHRARYARVKRVVDVALALLGIVPLLLLTPLVLAANLVGNRGPLVFRQERVGHRGRSFTMLKFRTMRSGGPADWTGDADTRVTPVGRLLRITHLDELPQVLNIVRGDLSFVGPRPEQVHYVEELRGKLPYYDLRHLIRPGLTGWAQVKFGYASSERDALEKLQYELFYLRRQSLALDLRILGRTVRHVVAGGGR